MAAYSVFFKESARRELDTIPKNDLQRIMARIASLADTPRPPGAEKLAGHELYRIRQGNYRILYSIQDGELTVWVVKVGHRRDVYRLG
jgi:mRNA interferase RelE/StbE